LASLANDDGNTFLTFNINPALLVNGTNTLAAEIHQASAGSSDISFDLRLDAVRHRAGVTSNDVDPDQDPLLVSVIAQPAHGTLNLTPATGFFSYTPHPGYHGVDSFTYRVNDGFDDSNVATVTFNIAGVNDRPTAVAGGPYTTLVNVPVQLNGTGSSDPETAAGSLIYQWDLNYDGATFQIDATGAQPTFSSASAFAPRTIGLRVRDPQGLTHIATTTLEVTVPPAGQVVGRYLFYNRSFFDGNNAAANAGDDAAIDTSKAALLPGQTAGFANYSGYSRGINGVMIDLANRPAGTITAADFAFRIGNNNSVASWTSPTSSPSVSIRTGAGLGGSDRLTLIWDDNTIARTWLQVTMLANTNTGLAANDVFYFGNAIGDVGNTTANAIVTAADESLVRVNFTTGFGTVPVTSPYDIDKNRFVQTSDAAISRANQTTAFTALRLIVVPAAGGQGGGSAAGEELLAPELVDLLVEPRRRRR
jgi:hypothetical protein